jgi:hypothetical protein
MTNPQAPRPVHSTAFAGISGVAFPTEQTSGPGNSVRAVALPNGALLLDPAGRWALRLHKIGAESAHVLLQVLRDLAPAATQQDSTLVRRVAVYDDACSKDSQLATQIRDGMQLLDSLARKLTKRRYLEIEERAMRRNLLMQLADVSVFARMGVPGGALQAMAT